MVKQEPIRVLMVGPGEGVGGGIFALVETFLPELKQQVKVNFLASVRNRALKDSGRFTFRNLTLAFSLYVRFAVALVRYRPNIIHIHTSQGIAWLKDTLLVLIGKTAGCSVVLHMHGGNFDQIYAAYPRSLQAYTRKILRTADGIISVSEEWKNRLTKIIPANKVSAIRNCVDIHLFQPGGNHRYRDAVNLLFLGRIGAQKGIYELIEAFHEIQPDGKGMQLWLVGPEENPGDAQNAQALLERYRLTATCKLVGEVDRERVIQYFRDASLFVLPSYYEGLPMVVLEALSAGLPVVATPAGGIPEVVLNGVNGFLVPVGDVQTLKEKIQTLCADADLRAVMGQRSREIAESELNVNVYVGRLIQLYSRLLIKRGMRRSVRRF
ncbi:MAG: glycosyltransferase family 4 protein [Anaerolineaceae bacterium]